MSQPYLGDIRPFGFNFAPRGWAMCNGQILAISQNSALFAILGTTYGGNGQTTFALPDLRSRRPVHYGLGYNQGQAAGQEAVTLAASQLPAHNHLPLAHTSGPADTGTPNSDAVWGLSTTPIYGTVVPPSPKKDATAGLMAADALRPTGGSQPHDNQPPIFVLNFSIALVGIFPSRN